jgi:SAM-dependent methyltransferase
MKTQTSEELKEIVRKQYTAVAEQDRNQNESSCCGTTCCSTEVYNIMSDDYSKLPGYNPDADLGLGCGLPTQYSGIKKGDFVVDLGSGAGNDCFIARQEAGPEGKIIGIDMTDAMINKARMNAEKLGLNNVEFRLGDIEKIPLTSGVADVVISNCVLNLVPDKSKAYNEIFRILKPGGRFSISDVVIVGNLPETLKQTAEMYAGCISGALQKDEYLEIISTAGFANIKIAREKQIAIPEDILKNYLNDDEISAYNESGLGIFSITVNAEKAAQCCDSDTCCK